ncbi:MAG: DUF2892 domain-containing protein [Gammaproteobacteria bacterium]|nr:DUF2892 domain-containing protein [Gammaproteobacteria bacterium]
MSERSYRLVLGSTLLILIYVNYPPLYYAYIGLLFFEGITNWRIPILINRLRFGQDHIIGRPALACSASALNFEAERAMRIVFGLILIPAIFFLPKDLWFINWIIASFLTLAGLVNFCPTVVTLRFLGFK